MITRCIQVVVASIVAFIVGVTSSAAHAQPGEPTATTTDDNVVFRENVLEHLSRLQVLPEGTELPPEALRIDSGAKSPRTVDRAEAEADAERLFYLLANGYCGYGYFGGNGTFDQARTSALAELASRERWSPDDLARVLHDQLDFVHDCHLRVGERKLCTHQDFWYDDELELLPSADGLFFVVDGESHVLLSVNESPVEPYAFPSLNAAGEPVYRLGMLSRTEPDPITLLVRSDAGEALHERRLVRSDYEANRKIGSKRIGGIPVVRAGTFADAERESLEQFLDTTIELRGEPYVVLDIRGNGGGNTDWPKQWVTRFTGQQPSLKQVLTELETRTSMIGRVNVFSMMLASYPSSESAWVQGEIDGHERRAAAFDRPGTEPHWTPPRFPDTKPIPNDTTLIVAVDRDVASSGEGLLSYLHQQVDNVVVVGENTMGALEFGQISYHQLPHSKLLAVLPIKLNVPMDLVPREEIGFKPDLWVPPAHAVNYAVAAARRGTITTQTDVPDGYFDVPFDPERTWTIPLDMKFVPMLAGLSMGMLYWTVRLLRRRRGA